MLVGVAQSGGLELDEDLALLGPVEVDLLDLPVAVDFHSTAAFVFMCRSVRVDPRCRVENPRRRLRTIGRARGAERDDPTGETADEEVFGDVVDPMPPFSRTFWALISGNRMMLLAATTAVAAAS